ncbi:MAG: orotate phosphoribosyltransferase [Saprospiraceae bacterium]|nr:orotate phosphoribosyltransferase [Bacteroidia bacterium]MBT8229678.1 orotate phosphoribosyltransferase [Bacteroidia bacterium]NNF21638.1 orotate phosphoribosyltransferase [Saprospiraceae bacterium]NNK90498.1 orotate phosphoribosyltransferase [Saprospiraceae bacterium]
MSTIASQSAQLLLEIKAIRLNPGNPFTWASGLRSPIYCDNRILLSYPKIRDFIKKALADKTKAFREFDVIAGVATAGIAHGALLADALEKPFVYVRSKAKAHGRQNMIEGELQEGARVLVVEDLISTGMSSLAACDALQEAGADIVGVLAIFTYGFDISKQRFSDRKIPLDTLTNYRNLIYEALEKNYISEKEKYILQDWNKDPKKWDEEYKLKID